MTIDLNQKIQELKDQVANSLIKKQKEEEDRLAKIERSKQSLNFIIPLINKNFEKKEHKEFLDFYIRIITSVGNEVNIPSGDAVEATWTFSIAKTDLKCKVKAFINKYNEVSLSLQTIPSSKYIYYIISDSNFDFNFAKVERKSIFYRCNLSVNTDEQQRKFELVRESEIQWILSVENMADEILSEVMDCFMKELKR